MRWIGRTIHIQDGDILTSKKGFAAQSYAGAPVMCHKMKHVKDDIFEILDETVKEIKTEES